VLLKQSRNSPIVPELGIPTFGNSPFEVADSLSFPLALDANETDVRADSARMGVRDSRLGREISYTRTYACQANSALGAAFGGVARAYDLASPLLVEKVHRVFDREE
jgi:hypothetical protein